LKSSIVVKTLCAFLLFAPLGCHGSWADQTVVSLKPAGKSAMQGVAIVSIGRTCDSQGRCRYEGSAIATQITAGSSAASYRVFLAKGSCTRPPKDGIELARDSGETLRTQGAGAHVDIPVSPLTGGAYVIVIETAKRALAACGTIRRTGWW
jgi:hypothetical protein